MGGDNLVNQDFFAFATKCSVRNSCSCASYSFQFHCLPLSLYIWCINHIVTSRAWPSTLDQQQIVFCIHAYNFQRLGSHLFCTHVSCHLLALPYAARSLALTDRTRSTMGQGVTVGHILSTEIPALNTALEAFTLGRTSHVNCLSCLELRNGQLITNAQSFFSAEF